MIERIGRALGLIRPNPEQDRKEQEVRSILDEAHKEVDLSRASRENLVEVQVRLHRRRRSR